MWKIEYVIEPFPWEDIAPDPEGGVSRAEIILDRLGEDGYQVIDISTRPDYGLYFTLERVSDDEDDEPEDPGDEDPISPEGQEAIVEADKLVRAPSVQKQQPTF